VNVFCEPLDDEELVKEIKTKFGQFDKHLMMRILTEYMVLELPNHDDKFADLE